MSISVIIVNYNSGDLLKQCLLSINKQTIAPANIIVVDNASSDNSVECAADSPGIKLLKMARNLGFAAANNIAISECDTEFIALLNPDAFPEPDWLETLMKAAAGNPDVAAFGSRQMSHGRDGIHDGTGDVYHISGLVWRNGYLKPPTGKDMLSREIFSPCAAAALYRRQSIVDARGFDEDFFCYLEDVDLGFRLRLAGHRSLYVPEAIVYHIGSALTGPRHSSFSLYYGHRNLVWTFVKNMPNLLFWLLLPAHVILNVVTIVWFISIGKGSTILKAKQDAIIGLPKAWSKRKLIQAKRIVPLRDIWRVMDKRFICWK